MVILPRPYDLVKVDPGNTTLLEQFLKEAGSSLDSFRYFEKRGLGVLKDHVCTLLICLRGKPLAYGHLDREKKTVWLGIAVADSSRGKGLGTLMMHQLMDFAEQAGVERIRLSVDNDNHSAIELYRRFLFKTVEKQEHLRFMEREVKQLTVGVSTVAFRKLGFEDAVRIAEEEELFIEFSSGMPPDDSLMKRFLSAKTKRMPHNYFPPAKDPYVLNLASANEEIRRRSVDHCIRNIEACKKVRAPFFAAHAGFCYDPDPSMLGQQITVRMEKTKDEHWRLFLVSVSEILEHAETHRVPFLIENNVLIADNLIDGVVNPLLCCEQEEVKRLIHVFDHPMLGFLLDTAHLKVSANTLDLDLHDEMQGLLSFVSAVHHSDNDGTCDSNQRMPNDYWFLPYMKDLNDKVHVVEVKDLQVEEVKQQIALLNASVYHT